MGWWVTAVDLSQSRGQCHLGEHEGVQSFPPDHSTTPGGGVGGWNPGLGAPGNLEEAVAGGEGGEAGEGLLARAPDADEERVAPRPRTDAPQAMGGVHPTDCGT